MTHNKGYARPVLSVRAAWWTVRITLLIMSFGLILRACASSGNDEERSGVSQIDSRDTLRDISPPRTEPPPSSSREKVITLELKPGVWSDPWWPGPTGGDAKWKTADGKIEAMFKFADGSEKNYTLELGKWPDFSKEPMFRRDLHFDIRFRHQKMGTITLTSFR